MSNALNTMVVPIRPAPVAPGGKMPWVLALLVGLMAAAIGGAWWWNYEQGRQAVARERKALGQS